MWSEKYSRKMDRSIPIRKVRRKLKFIDAVWEKRNLGVSCVEIEIGRRDSATEVINAIRSRQEQYQVIKLAPGRPDLMFVIQDEGFRYMETMVELGRRFDGPPETPEICKGYVKDIGYHYANALETEHVFSEMKKGEIFTTDRIALDPVFSREMAGKRYALWMYDVLTSGRASLAIISYQQKDIGFDIHLNKDRYCELLLGGYFKEYHGCGYGFAGEYVTINRAYEEGARAVRTHVSSNNLYALKMHMLFGLRICSLAYVFIKHK